MLTITPQELISAARIAADACRDELAVIVGGIDHNRFLKKALKDNKPMVQAFIKETQRLKRRKAKLERTLLILKHMYM